MLSVAQNVRRLMARDGMTLRDVVDRSGLHERTVKAALAGRCKPHARTLHRLAAGLGVSTDELFQSPAVGASQRFDRFTNPAAQEVVGRHPQLFIEWTNEEFDEFYSHFGTGGEMSNGGAVQIAEAINQKRAVHRKVALLLESGEASLLIGVVDLLYQKIIVHDL